MYLHLASKDMQKVSQVDKQPVYCRLRTTASSLSCCMCVRSLRLFHARRRRAVPPLAAARTCARTRHVGTLDRRVLPTSPSFASILLDWTGRFLSVTSWGRPDSCGFEWWNSAPVVILVTRWEDNDGVRRNANHLRSQAAKLNGSSEVEGREDVALVLEEEKETHESGCYAISSDQ